jgi:catechol 2,3-dioxygenase-like lactoylglutathione lyase family enzyme
MTIVYDPTNLVIAVNVSDYDRSLSWYRDVLGFEVSYELAEYGWCELTTPFGPSPTFGVVDIDAAVAHLRAHDVEVEDWHQVGEMVRLSTFYDPDGTPWMLSQTLDQKAGRQ